MQGRNTHPRVNVLVADFVETDGFDDCRLPQRGGAIGLLRSSYANYAMVPCGHWRALSFTVVGELRGLGVRDDCAAWLVLNLAIRSSGYAAT